MAFIYFQNQNVAKWIFGLGLLLLAGSLIISVYEIVISTKALNIQLSNLEEEEKKEQGFLTTKLFSKS